MKHPTSNPSDVNQRRTLLVNEIGAALPRNLWLPLHDLLKLEYSRGALDTITSFRQLLGRPKGRPGRPRLDQRGDEILRMKAEGKSWAQIANKLGIEREACRAHARRRLHEMERSIAQMKSEIERLQKEAVG
jgi:DNA-binding CsgD family transcriptional regulator